MALIRAHVTAAPDLKSHDGVWTLPLGDGSFLCTVQHAQEGVARHALARHPAVKHVVPSRRSGAGPHADTVTAVAAFLATQPAGVRLKANPSPDDVCQAVYDATGDPIWNPDTD